MKIDYEKADKTIREHCNIEYSKNTGEEIVNSPLSSVLIAIEEYSKVHLPVVMPRSCVICKCKINPLGEQTGKPESAMWDNGIVENIHGGYGSKHDLSTVTIAVCDNCIDKLCNNEA